MLGLADEIFGHNLRIGAVVGNHGDFGGAGEHVDADAAIEHALGLGDEAVARTDQNAGRLAGEQAEGHRRDALHPAKGKDGVGTALVHRIKDGRVRPGITARRGTGDDMLDTGHPRRGDRHDGRGHMRIAPARNIAACRFDRDQLLARPETRRQLGLEFGDRLFLRFGKGGHPVIGKTDIVLQLLGNLVTGGRDGIGRHDDIAVISVELAAIGDGGVLAAGLDLRKHCLDNLAGLVGSGLRGLVSAFQIGHGHVGFILRKSKLEATGQFAGRRRSGPGRLPE